MESRSKIRNRLVSRGLVGISILLIALAAWELLSVRVLAENYAVSSGDLAAPTWKKSDIRLDKDRSRAPDGTLSAQRITSVGNDGVLFEPLPALPSGTYDYSLYLRADKPTKIGIFLYSAVNGVNDGKWHWDKASITVTSKWRRHHLRFKHATRGLVLVHIGGQKSFTSGEAVEVWHVQLHRAVDRLYVIVLSALGFGALASGLLISLWNRTIYVPEFVSQPGVIFVFFAVIGAQVYMAGMYTPAIPIYDSAQYFATGYNIARHGVASISGSGRSQGKTVYARDAADPAAKADYRRDPFYPFLIASALLATGDLRSTSLSCILTNRAACGRYLTSYFVLNILTLVLISISTFFAAWVLTKLRGAALAAMALVALAPNLLSQAFVASSENTAALLLVLHSMFLVKTFYGNHKKTYAILAGVSLGLLALTRSAFYYWFLFMILSAFTYLLIKKARVPRSQITLAVLITVSAATVIVPWATRNYAAFGQFAISSGADKPMRARLEMDTMAWREYPAAYLFFTPYVGRELTDRYFGKDVSSHFYGTGPESYVGRRFSYKTVMSKTAIMMAMLKHWDMHVALIPFYLYSTSFIGGCCTEFGNEIHKHTVSGRAAAAFGPILSALHVFYVVVFLVVFPIFFIVVARALVKKNWPLVLFCSPALFSDVLYAVAVHHIPRYNRPLIPVLIVIAIVATMSFMEKWRGWSRAARGRTKRSPSQPA